MLRAIDCTDVAIARRVVEIQRDAYAVEAALIGFDGIPTLHETVDEVRRLGSLHWTGAFEHMRLVGLIAWTRDEQHIDIDRLAVDPVNARCGHGRRLVRSVPAARTTTVSTGAANLPAVRLYESEGFERVGSHEIAPGVSVAGFRRTG